MQVTSRSRLNIRLQNILFVVLLLAIVGMLAWLSTGYVYQADWTRGARNTLSATSQQLLATLSEPLRITAYASNNDAVRRPISEVIARYQRYKSDIELEFVDPGKEPERTRNAGVTLDGELVIEYQGRSDKQQGLNEQAISNTLQRLARTQARFVVFIEGHGERNPLGEANHDLGSFGRELGQRGIQVQTVNLATTPQIPANTGLLVLAGARVDYLPGELAIIQRYIDQGGNLLWLGDPGPAHGLEKIGEALGVRVLPGVIVDTTTQMLGIEQPDFAVVVEYPPHPLTRNFQLLTLFPQAAALELSEREGWQHTEILTTLERAWTEAGPLVGEIRHDAEQDERAGPLTLGVALTRPRPNGEAKIAENDNASEEPGPEQRIIVIGDGDFLANSYLGNGGNLDLGLGLVNWLSHDDSLINIPAKTAPDTTLTLSEPAMIAISVGYLIVLPLALISTGTLIWLRRRRR